jgi:EAL domain-containing protein (putative c-di-GMP-specific phosphodiesterase class I)
VRLGADVGQGNFVGKPQPAEELEIWLEQSGGRPASLTASA